MPNNGSLIYARDVYEVMNTHTQYLSVIIIITIVREIPIVPEVHMVIQTVSRRVPRREPVASAVGRPRRQRGCPQHAVGRERPRRRRQRRHLGREGSMPRLRLATGIKAEHQ